MESRFLISSVQRSRFYDIRTCARTIEQKGATLGTRKVVTRRADGRHDWLFVGGNLIKVRDAFLLCLRRSRSQWANGPLLFSASQGHGAPQATTYVRLAISTHTPTHRPTRQELLTTDPYIFVRWLILIIIPAHDTKHFGIYFGLGTIILQLVSEQWNRCIAPNSTSDGCIWKIVWQPLRKNILVRSNPPSIAKIVPLHRLGNNMLTSGAFTGNTTLYWYLSKYSQVSEQTQHNGAETPCAFRN